MDPKKPILDVDPDAPPSEEERALAEELRSALADPRIANENADFARALALANEPREIGNANHRALVDRALAGASPRGNVLRLTFGVASIVSLAAAAILVLGRFDMNATTSRTANVAAPSLVSVRSTQELFDQPFARPLSRGAASARIDRIAMAREGDLRENRFAMWGVR